MFAWWFGAWACCMQADSLREHDGQVMETDVVTFSCDGIQFEYFGEGWSQGRQSIVSDVKSGGKSFIMKRPNYKGRLWDDNLQKECFLLNYLNNKGLQGIPKCVAECILIAEDVGAIIEQPVLPNKDPEFERGRDESTNPPSWHAIIMELVPGSGLMQGHVNLNNETAEKRAIQNMLQTTWDMLMAGVLNGDQYHNILFTMEGQANFIDFEGASFISTVPLQELGGNNLVRKQSRFSEGGYKITSSNETESSLLGCKDFDVRLNGDPEMFMNGRFRPVCGYGFPEGQEGATAFCKALRREAGEVKVLEGTYSSEDAVYVPKCKAPPNLWQQVKLNECSGGPYSAPAGAIGAEASNSLPWFLQKSCAAEKSPKLDLQCLPGKSNVPDSCDDSMSLLSMLQPMIRMIPTHALQVASKSFTSRLRLGEAKLDRIIDELGTTLLDSQKG